MKHPLKLGEVKGNRQEAKGVSKSENTNLKRGE